MINKSKLVYYSQGFYITVFKQHTTTKLRFTTRTLIHPKRFKTRCMELFSTVSGLNNEKIMMHTSFRKWL